MKKKLIFILFLTISSIAIYSIPNNLPTPGTISPVLNSDQSLSIAGPGTQGQIQMKSSTGNYLYLNAPNAAAPGFGIIFMDSPTNGFFLGTITNGTNIVLTSVKGISQNMDVIIPGSTTNHLFITNGLIMNIVPQ